MQGPIRFHLICFGLPLWYAHSVPAIRAILKHFIVTSSIPGKKLQPLPRPILQQCHVLSLTSSPDNDIYQLDFVPLVNHSSTHIRSPFQRHTATLPLLPPSKSEPHLPITSHLGAENNSQKLLTSATSRTFVYRPPCIVSWDSYSICHSKLDARRVHPIDLYRLI